MVTASSLYELLGVATDASDAELAAAHRRAAKRHHPDTGGDRARFEAIQRAAETLRDPARRARYDRTGDVDDAPDNALAELTRLLAAAFDHVMAQRGAEERDVIAAMRQLFERQRQEVATQTAEAQRQIARLTHWRERLHHAGDGPDVIARTLDGRATQLERQIGALQQRGEQLRRALDELDRYSWRDDPSPALPPWESLTSTDL